MIINESEMGDFDIFKGIFVGGFSKDALIQRLVDAGVKFNKYAHILFEHPSFSPDPSAENLKLVKSSLSELGLSIPCSFQTVIDRASVSGLRPCPLYLGAFLRLEYMDQPQGPYLTIASLQPESSPESDESLPSGFYIRNYDNSLWLRGYRVVGDAEWPENNELVFLS